MKISYVESMLLRGIAILLMIWVHCFNKDKAGDTYVSLIPMLGGVSFPYILTRLAQICVSIYCFLSGYGLYCKYPYGRSYVIRKTMVLAIQYWIVLTIFISIGYFWGVPYDFTWGNFFSNYLGYKTSWNSTLWFLLPYIMLLLASRLVIKFIKKSNYLLLCIIVLYGISCALLKSEKTGELEYNPLFFNLLEFFKMLFPFSIGAYCKKYECMENHLYEKKVWIVVAALIVLSRLVIWNNFLLPFCSLAFIYLVHGSKISDQVSSFLVYMGHKSTMLWFCHAYFIYYYLKGLVYVGKYPLFIFCLALAFSLLSAVIIGHFYNKIEKKVFNK